MMLDDGAFRLARTLDSAAAVTSLCVGCGWPFRLPKCQAHYRVLCRACESVAASSESGNPSSEPGKV